MKMGIYTLKLTALKIMHHCLTMLCLSYLIFSGCSAKPETTTKNENPFSSAVDSEATTSSQILKPCTWSYTVEQDPSSNEVVLVSTAKLDSGWHLYSQHISKKAIATVFAYNVLPNYKLIGVTEEGESKKEYNQYLETEVLFFENEAVFRQKINTLSKEDFTITGTIDYMVCFEQCVPSDEEFSFSVKGK